MSNQQRPSSARNDSTPGELPQNPLTVEGYKKIFDDSDNVSTSFVLLNSCFPKNIDWNFWNNFVEKSKSFREYRSLNNYYQEIQGDLQTRDEKIRIKYIEVFSLLESVFRNALCRSYIPAYRSINMDCGRYRCYINKREERLMKDLGFQESSSNLITYSEQDQKTIVILALTCSVLWCELFKVFEMKKT